MIGSTQLTNECQHRASVRPYNGDASLIHVKRESGIMVTDMSLDTIIRLLELAAIVGGGGMVVFRLGQATQKMEQAVEAQSEATRRHSEEISELRMEIRKLNDVLTQLALAEQRMQMLERMIDELRRGEGFILPLQEAFREMHMQRRGGQPQGS